MSISELSGYIKTCLEELSISIGNRPAGSAGHIRAEEFIAKHMKQSGFMVVIQSYKCPFWELESYSLAIGKEVLNAIPNTFSPACDISSSIVTLSSIEDLTQKKLDGKIAVLYRQLAERSFFPKNFDFFRDEQQDKIISLIEEKKPLAIIMVDSKDDNQVPLIEDSDFHIPSMTVSQKTGEYLLKNDGNNAKFKISSHRKESFSSNIVARKMIEGSGRIVICAHYDTKYGTPGALDNASGVAALLALAKMMKEDNCHIGVEFVFFGGEDSWYPGDVDYAKRNEEYLNTVVSAINIDGIGFKGSENTIAFLECPQSLTEKILRLKEKYPEIVQIEPWYDSDQSLFWPRGIPSIAMTSHNVRHLIDNIVHTKFDTLDLLDLSKITEAVSFIYEVLKM